MLRLVLPKGTLESPTLKLFEEADLAVSRSSDVDYKATIDDPRVTDVRILRPQEIPLYVADGMFDLGVTGRDWIEEQGAEVVSLGQLRYSKNTSRPANIVLAVAEDSAVESVRDLKNGVRVSTEYPGLTRRFFAGHGIEADITLSYGATEAKIPDIADAVVDLTETGRAFRQARLRIIDTILSSYTELVANPAAYEDPAKRHAMEQIHTLLQGTLEARAKVLVKLNVASDNLQRVIELVPSMKSPTVSKLYDQEAYAVETVVAKADINTLIPALKDAGASDIIELPLSKIVH
ncbi:MAG: phosphoribosyltransferase [Actinomycetota bacterium]|jgi:ATP phosphoribosyltransferase|nr:phosphoribosyltransferase [Actinomycetota bacterium]